MTHLVKGAVATASMGTVATGSYFGYSYFSSQSSIEDHLVKSNYMLISSISARSNAQLQWEAEFESDKNKIKALIGFEEDDKKKGGEALEKWCSTKLKESYSERHRDLEGVKNYCTIRDINSQLERKGSSVLTENEGDKSKWINTYNKRKATTKRSPRSQITGLEGEWGSSGGTTHSQDGDLTKIKTWCKLKSKSHFYAYEQAYDYVYNWCTEGGASVEESQ